eukprot:2143037-Pleurochrysis_carterae.AAC.1
MHETATFAIGVVRGTSPAVTTGPRSVACARCSRALLACEMTITRLETVSSDWNPDAGSRVLVSGTRRQEH